MSPVGIRSVFPNVEEAYSMLRKMMRPSEKLVQQYGVKKPLLFIGLVGKFLEMESGMLGQFLSKLQAKFSENYTLGEYEGSAFEVVPSIAQGAYVWLTINFLKNLISNSRMLRQSTVGVINMMTENVTISYLPPIDVNFTGNEHENGVHFVVFEDVPEINEYDLYSVSHKGYGLEEAFFAIVQNSGITPCLNSGQIYALNSTHSIIGSGNPYRCLELIGNYFKLFLPCLQVPCSINGTYQASFGRNLQFYSNSYEICTFFNFTDEFTPSELKEKSIEYCLKDGKSLSEAEQYFEGNFQSKCFEGLYFSQLLVSGFNLIPDKKIMLTKKINSFDIDWKLGFFLEKLSFMNESQRCNSSFMESTNIHLTFSDNKTDSTHKQKYSKDL